MVGTFQSFPMGVGLKVVEKKFIAKTFQKEVTKSGHGGHITTSRKYVGDLAEVKIIRTLIKCKKCNEEFCFEATFQKNKNYCDSYITNSKLINEGKK